MIKRIIKIGNSCGVALGATILKRAGLKPGDQVNVAIHHSGALVLTALDRCLTAEEIEERIKRALSS